MSNKYNHVVNEKMKKNKIKSYKHGNKNIKLPLSEENDKLLIELTCKYLTNNRDEINDASNILINNFLIDDEWTFISQNLEDFAILFIKKNVDEMKVFPFPEFLDKNWLHLSLNQYLKENKQSFEKYNSVSIYIEEQIFNDKNHVQICESASNADIILNEEIVINWDLNLYAKQLKSLRKIIYNKLRDDNFEGLQVINAELIRKVEKLSSFCMKYFENWILLLVELILNNEWISSGNNNPIIEYLELLVSEGWNF